MKPHLNKGLFSNYYLEELLPREEVFKIPLSELERSLEEIKRILDKKYLSSLNEPQLRKHFLDKVFEILGWTIDVEPPTPSGEWSRHPDYALFYNPEDLKLSQGATKEEYFKKTLCLGEAKHWGRALDKKVKVDTEDPQNPSLQISRYLWLTEVKWGILTDGRYWRLYERETSKRLDIFYEIDLEDLIENGSIDDFKYFCLFFRRDAFPDFLETVYKESVDYAEAVGKELKENVYQALKALAQGFLKTPENDLKEIHLKKIHDNSLILLYRLLFILYAEYRDLLPLGENQYYTESYSLDAFKKEIADRLDKHEPIATSTHGYWNKLKELFEIINIGNRELGVPPYNGGLFEPDKHEFLERYRVGDLYIAKAVDLLSRSSDRAYIDYGSLEIRHLGSIYEGLLEYKLKIAEEDLVPLKQKGKEIFIQLEETKKAKKKIKEEEIVREGEIYLATDKGERKATGSYYTPDYIVNYIIDNTLGPLVERIYRESKLAEEIRNSIRHFNEIFEEIVKERGEEEKQNLPKLWNLTRNDQERRDFLLNLLDGAEPSHGYDPLERILQLKILDPAMGSGHFLVEATDYLARELLKVLSGEPLLKPSKEMVIREAKEPYSSKEPEEEDIRWARREVIERCIFGVDLNPLAVELAKLSLWLYTVAKNRPLNFLDHHLRCGNSLIGARIGYLASPPSLKKKKAENAFKQLGLFENAFREKVAILLKSFKLIETHPSDTVEQIREKESYYQDFRRALSRFQDVADAWASVYFGNEIDFWSYQRLHDELRATDDEWEKLTQESWFKRAKKIAEEKKFFHWELEFPEVFFEGNQEKGNPGFDGVVGNPPYINAIELNRILSPYEKPFWKKQFEASLGAYDIYLLFFEVGLRLLSNGHLIGLITPNKFLSAPYAIAFRELIVSKHQLVSVCDWSKVKVFETPSVYPIVSIFEKWGKSAGNYLISISRVNASRVVTERTIHQSQYLSKLPDFIWGFLLSSNFNLVFKISSVSNQLCEVSTVQATSTAAESDIFTPAILNSYRLGAIKLINTGLIDRYCNSWELDSLFHKGAQYSTPYLNIIDELVPESRRSLYERPKIIFAKIALLIEGFLDTKGEFASINTNCVCDCKYSLAYLCALLNSKLMMFIYNEYFGALRMAGGYFQFQAPQLALLPIRHIAFVTPKVELERLVERSKDYYRGFLKTGNPDALLYPIRSDLIKEHEPDPELLKRHNDNPLNKHCQIREGALWEQSDVVHNVLTFLAEQIIEMNKDKQKENRGFFEWLERQLKIQPDKKGNIGIEGLTGKTQIKNYLGEYQKGEEQLSFEDFWTILETNKTRIQTNLKSRELFDGIKTEYEKSLSRLIPIKEKLYKTDWLIDQIVYKLYGLTEEEIGIVEEHK